VAQIVKADLSSTFAVLDPAQRATLIKVTPTIYEELDRRFNEFTGHWLVSCHAFDKDWSSWERHPAGDEIVCLLSGETTMILDRDGVHESIQVSEPGSYVVVPKGLWHTAKTSVPTKMLFITPGAGTENKDA
jgi:mannose-6-phosphate isomerase-like protein (cupin superfamily)